MANKICKHGEHAELEGGGIYFICRFDWEESGEKWRKNSSCRYSRWCKEDKRYYASTDKNGFTCLHFELLRPFSAKEEVSEVEKFFEKEQSSYGDEDMINDLESMFENYNTDQE